MNLTFSDFRMALLDYEFTNVVAIFRKYNENPTLYIERGPLHVLERLEALEKRRATYSLDLLDEVTNTEHLELTAFQRILELTTHLSQKFKTR